MANLERVYNIPLGKAYETVRSKRTPRAVKILREFLTRHMKAKTERIIISEALNSYLWERSIQKPPRSVKIRAIKDDGAVRAYLSDEKVEDKKQTQKKDEKKAEPAKTVPVKEEKPASKTSGKETK